MILLRVSALLRASLIQVCTNPTNPMFAHYMFESVAALMKFICESSPDSVAAFEGMLFAPFQEVLTRDVSDFMPYVFQLLAQLLELRPAPRIGQAQQKRRECTFPVFVPVYPSTSYSHYTQEKAT
jgi:hypothetical protein